MTDDIDPLDDFIHAVLQHRGGDGPEPQLADLDPSLRPEAAARLRILNAARTPVLAPAGATDRLARRFGFDRAGTAITVSGARVKAARKAAGLELKDVAAAIAAAGAPVKTSELLNVEQAKSTALDQKVVTRLVAVLGVPLDQIEESFSDQVDRLAALLETPRFAALIADWANEHNRDHGEVRNDVHRQLSGARYRAESVSEDQLFDIVKAILDTMS